MQDFKDSINSITPNPSSNDSGSPSPLNLDRLRHEFEAALESEDIEKIVAIVDALKTGGYTFEIGLDHDTT